MSDDLAIDRPKEECGVFGVVAPGRDVSRLAFYALHALQHRGQESAGIAVARRRPASPFSATSAWCASVFDEPSLREPDRRRRPSATCATPRPARTSGTTPSRSPTRAARASSPSATTATSPTPATLRAGMEADGVGPARQHRLGDHRRDARGRGGQPLLDAVAAVMPRLVGAYSVVAMSAQRAGRVPRPARRAPAGDRAAATTTAGASPRRPARSTRSARSFVRDVRPGEAVRITGRRHREPCRRCPSAGARLCVFEHIYFARPDSQMDGQTVWEARRAMGTELAARAPPRPTWWWACPTAARRRRSASPTRRASPTPRRSCATATSAAASSSPTRRCASTASA